MLVKIKKSNLDYLFEQLSSKEPSLFNKLNGIVRDFKVTFEIDSVQADEIRDWIEEEIQKVGYGEDYNLNKEGKILQELADKFYS